MPKYSEQDLKYAAELREDIHREALAIVRKTRPNSTEVVDRHPIEDYFQKIWEYPGKWYTVVAIPYGYRSRKDFVDAIVKDTLAENTPEKEETYPQQLRDMTKDIPKHNNDLFYRLLDDYPDLVVDYFIVDDKRYLGYESHQKALKTAYAEICEDWDGDPDKPVGKSIAKEELFSQNCPPETLNYRKAFLYPPYENSYTDKDFTRVNAALFPNGTDELEVYEWNTDWSEYFDEGHEWWGTLCLTVYDKSLNRFVIIMASATD